MPLPNALTLRHRVLRAGGWSVAGYISSMAIRLGSSLLMTRLLVPEMFGVMAIATAVMAGLAMFSDFGLRQSIVQNPRGNEPAFLNTAWSLQIVRGLLIFACALGIAFVLVLVRRLGLAGTGTVYADAQLPWVIAATSASAIIMGFESTKLSEATRILSLARPTQLELVAQLAGLVCMMFWASFDRSIWALVSGGIFASLVRVLLSHVWLPGANNSWHWEPSLVREVLNFGKWIFASSVLGFLVNNGDRLFLGALLDTTMLGVYSIAALIFGSVEQILSKLISDVSFPALAETVRERRSQLKAHYYRFHAPIAAFTYFGAGILMIAGHLLIELIYDARYHQAGWMLEILAIGLLSLPFRVASLCFVALGLPHLHSNVIAIRLVTMMLAMPIGFHYFGAEGALWGLVLSHLTYALATVAYTARLGLVDLRKELMLLTIPPLGIAFGSLFRLATGA
jgi:O-antigen/teichoic acid export membrane protein